ncbi:MAG: 3-phosphoshikimate 1-carboxyvinyltransferase, partial [Bacteroidia bacterium]|nr:3-phosphoshikimate 1-carboxyvinyltransferase [Bacteroidia bacterium]
MQTYFYNKPIKGSVEPASSKSIMNRVLIINALLENKIIIQRPASSKDSEVLIQLLTQFELNKNNKQTLDAGIAGTTFRFLTAYFATRNCKIILTGHSRMKERPIAPLIEALNNLGAKITYLEKEGYPPIYIEGKEMEGGSISINGNISSQFITALLLVAPYFKNGLSLTYTQPLISAPYISMTISLMQYFGAKVSWNDNCISVSNKPYTVKKITIESDWSSASYIYLTCLLAKQAEIFILGLQENSIQGDSVVVEFFDELGVKTMYQSGGVLIKKRSNYAIPAVFEFDFITCPDLAQTLAVAVSIVKAKAVFKGIASLRIKETDRVQALKNELKK